MRPSGKISTNNLPPTGHGAAGAGMPERAKPVLAVIARNTLAAMGLAALIEEVMPIAETRIYSSLSEVSAEMRHRCFHFFISMGTLMEAPEFFRRNAAKTIVITEGVSHGMTPAGFRTLDATLPRGALLKSFLMMEQAAHGGGRRLPEEVRRHALPDAGGGTPLTRRETQVLGEIVRGYINKEIAAHLGISLTTVITHRKNIVAKLKAHSVSQLTIYAVTNGIVRPEEI